MQIHGIIPPVATPMLANEDLDLPRLRWFLDHLIANGVHGVFVLGTNSEFYALDEREKQEVIATAVEHVNKRVPGLRGHRRRVHARGGSPHADGGEGRGRRRVGDHAVFHQSQPAGDR